jgi:hypothetical protein
MLDSTHLEDHLGQARMHVAIGVRRVVEQRARVEHLRFAGSKRIHQADQFLQVLERALTVMLHHRDLLDAEMRLARLGVDFDRTPRKLP